MKEEWLKRAFNEFAEATADALALVTTAVARQLNAAQLTEDLRSTLQAAQAVKAVSPTAIRLAAVALAAAEAESIQQNPARH